MTDDYARSVIAVSTVDHKQAALYFDRIFPCTGYDEVPQEVRLDYRLLRDNYVKYADEYEVEGMSAFEEFEDGIKSTTWEHETLWVANDYAFSAADALIRQSIPAVPLFYPDEPWEDYARLFYRHPIDGITLQETVETTLMDMRIVDTKNVHWKQIVEVKQDEEALKRLRNFRLFAHENFKDKSKNYISDKLDQKFDEYEQACKKHGFDLISSSVSMLLDSKSLLGLCAIAAASIWAGNQHVAAFAAIGEAVIETSKLTINVLTKRREFSIYKTNTELAYLIDLKERLEAKPIL